MSYIYLYFNRFNQIQIVSFYKNKKKYFALLRTLRKLFNHVYFLPSNRMNKLLSEFITNCGGHFGIVGAKKMNASYFPSEKASLREAKQIPQSPGVEFLNRLIGKGKLFPTYHSFNLLAENLFKCNLHRACNALRTCLNETGLLHTLNVGEEFNRAISILIAIVGNPYIL